jgi:hypothetical protein
VATQPDQVAEGAPEVEEPQTPTSDSQIATDAAPEGDDDDDEQPPPDPVDELARSMGWRPKDQFKGDPNLWKPAKDYIKAGAEIQRGLSRDLKELRGTVDTMTRTQAAILEQTLAEQRDKLVARYNRAVEDGDAQTSFQVSRAIDNLNGQARALQQPQERAEAPPPEAIDWVERNQWFNHDPLARDLALNVAQRYAEANHGVDAQLQAAEREVRKIYPHLFGASSKEPPGVAQPGGRSGSGGRKGSTYADLPQAAKTVAKDMAERGVIPNVEAYAKQYWQNQKAGA